MINVINNAKKGAFKDSAYGIVEAANLYYSTSMLKSNGEFSEKTFTVTDGKLKTISGEELTFKGSVPSGDSWVKITSSGEVSLNITDGKYYASKEANEVAIEVTETEGGALSREELTAEIENLKNEIVSLKGKDTAIENKNNEQDTTISNITKVSSSDNVFLKTYPVGSIYTSVSNTNPSTLFGGTWVSYGAGRTLVGVDSSQTEFATVEKTGGEKNHTLTVAEMPSHYHVGLYWKRPDVSSRQFGVDPGGSYAWQINYTTTNQSDGPIITGNEGGSQPHNNLQPYITVYMWKRTK